jgi:hypothetical protein
VPRRRPQRRAAQLPADDHVAQPEVALRCKLVAVLLRSGGAVSDSPSIEEEFFGWSLPPIDRGPYKAELVDGYVRIADRDDQMVVCMSVGAFEFFRKQENP